MFRYLNYVRSRLSTHLGELQTAPDLLLLLRDLHAWCAREAQGRGLTTPSAPSMQDAGGDARAQEPRVQDARLMPAALTRSRSLEQVVLQHGL